MKCKRKRGLKTPLYGKGTRSARRVTHIGSEIVIKNKINMQVLRLHLLLKQALSRCIYNLKKKSLKIFSSKFKKWKSVFNCSVRLEKNVMSIVK